MLIKLHSVIFNVSHDLIKDEENGVIKVSDQCVKNKQSLARSFKLCLLIF